MFKTDKFYQYTPADTIVSNKEYVLKSKDVLEIQILSNNGYQLVDVLGQTGYYYPVTYTIHNEGFAVLPMLDSLYLAGYSITGAENLLSERYSYYFVNPYIKIKVINRRCVVYPGRGNAQVVNLDNEGVSLIEVLALAGGLGTSKAYRIKLIRGDLRNPQVFLIDLSTIEGMKKANLQVSANDIIYVEPALTFNDINQQILPVITLITTSILIYTNLIAIKK
ncbi:MAG: polysaccharide biosynthesis/export family protein [Bacteroidota bacterium]